MAYGSPKTLADVEGYYTHIRGGRKPTREQVEDLLGRYSAIGGASPLRKITEKQASGLQASLGRLGSETRVYAGMKHSTPFIGDEVRRAYSEGVHELLCIALAPHYSGIGIGGYFRAVEEARTGLGDSLRVKLVKSWHDNPELVRMWAARVRSAGQRGGDDPSLVFSAHSLPERILREGDPYRDQLLKTSRLVAKESGWKDWSFAFQSASETGEPWLGPDILDHLQNLYESGKRSFVVAPIGFVSDHLEILYDIDVECKGWASRRKLSLVRCESPNDSNELIGVLMSIVIESGFA
jgi:ferrochelatase